MKAEVRVEGLEELDRKIGQFVGPIMAEEAEVSMDRSLAVVESNAVQNVNHAKDSGEHPQVQSGRLIGSIMSEKQWTGDVLQGNTGSNTEYGPDLEYGHMTRGRTVTYLGVSITNSRFVGPYPWLQPALEEALDYIEAEFDWAVERAIKRACKS